MLTAAHRPQIHLRSLCKEIPYFLAFDQRTNKLLAGLVLSGTWLKIALEPAHK